MSILYDESKWERCLEQDLVRSGRVSVCRSKKRSDDPTEEDECRGGGDIVVVRCRIGDLTFKMAV